MSHAIKATGNNQHIDFRTLRVQVQNRLIDQLVRRVVEIFHPQFLDHIDNRVGAQQHRTKHALLCLAVMGWLTVLR